MLSIAHRNAYEPRIAFSLSLSMPVSEAICCRDMPLSFSAKAKEPI